MTLERSSICGLHTCISFHLAKLLAIVASISISYLYLILKLLHSYSLSHHFTRKPSDREVHDIRRHCLYAISHNPYACFSKLAQNSTERKEAMTVNKLIGWTTIKLLTNSLEYNLLLNYCWRFGNSCCLLRNDLTNSRSPPDDVAANRLS